MTTAQLETNLAWIGAHVPVRFGAVWHRIITGAGLALAFALEATGIPSFSALFHLSSNHQAEVVMGITFAINAVHWLQQIPVAGAGPPPNIANNTISGYSGPPITGSKVGP